MTSSAERRLERAKDFWNGTARRDIKRVLRPGAMTVLQFENILSAAGLEEFQKVVGLVHDHPLEFHSSGELHQLLGSVGLEVFGVREGGSWISVTAPIGSATVLARPCALARIPLHPSFERGIASGSGPAKLHFVLLPPCYEAGETYGDQFPNLTGSTLLQVT